jgi:xanthine dehydrogenase accessory factor
MPADAQPTETPAPTPQILLVGVEPFGEELARQAALLGWSARASTDLDDAITTLELLGADDAVIVLDHQHRIATPVLAAALRGGVGYVGALGSRRMQEARVASLRNAGATDEEIAALHCPTGLDLGARTPAESAVSIVAEIIATRSGRDAQPLRVGSNRIGA